MDVISKFGPKIMGYFFHLSIRMESTCNIGSNIYVFTVLGNKQDRRYTDPKARNG